MNGYKIVSEAIPQRDYENDPYLDKMALQKSIGPSSLTGIVGGYVISPIVASKIKKMMKASKLKLVRAFSLPAAIFGFLGLLTVSIGMSIKVGDTVSKSYRKKLLIKGPKFFYHEKLKYLDKIILTIQSEINYYSQPDIIKQLSTKDDNPEDIKRFIQKELRRFRKLLKELQLEQMKTLQKLKKI